MTRLIRQSPVVTCKPSQGLRRRVRLFGGRSFAANGPSQVLICTDRDRPLGSEIHGNHVRHLSSLRSRLTPWPALSVIHQ